jgi:hypothetical protein
MSSLISLEINKTYDIELCSGEIRYWRYLGVGLRDETWWMDTVTGRVFNESGIMYAWKLLTTST